ncbi:hypothetical protein GF348_24450 [candidate division KSB3 bacterium]|nr:hypothetical protein [candidate division KSB3 bacterium]
MLVIRQNIPGGDSFTKRTLRRMRRLALNDQVDCDVRRLALKITEGIRGQDALTQIGAIRGWLMNHLMFTRDPRKHELLIAPRILVRSLRKPENHGIIRVDCDDVATLAAALGSAVGLDARFVAVAYLSNNNSAPRHVWGELAPPGSDQWQEMDVTRVYQGLPPKSAITNRWTLKV